MADTVTLPLQEFEALLAEAADLVEKITFDESGRMVAGHWVGGNGGLLQRETLKANDVLRRRLDEIGARVGAQEQSDGT